MSDLSLVPHSSVSEYFHEVLSDAMRNQGVEASAHTEFYLVNLLAEFTHASLPDEPLSLMLLQANEAEPSVRLRKLRSIGDQTLYVSGFFADSLEARCIDADYYISIGGTAYATLGRSGAPPWSATFQELSSKFGQLVEVLTEVAQSRQVARSSDVLNLYERYLRTGSRSAERQLRRLGLGLGPLMSAGLGTPGKKGPSA